MGGIAGGLGALGGLVGKMGKGGKGGGSDSPQGTPVSDKYREPESEPLGTLHSGGKVKKTGNYRLRKNELVLTMGQQRSAGLKKTNKKINTKKRTASKG